MIRLNFNMPPPGCSLIDWPARDIDALRCAVAELLCGAQPVALGAEAADVAVVVGASATERNDVVGHGCGHD